LQRRQQLNKPIKDGYFIFFASVAEDKGYEKLAAELTKQINEVEKEYDIAFLSGASFKDDPGSRNTFFASQSAVLTKKKGK
jgi:rubrerythrin